MMHKQLFSGLLAILLLIGCGRGSAPDQGSATPPPAAAPAPAATQPAAPASVAASPQPQPEKPDPGRKETKWIGKIPYDVFYDQPLTIATDTTVIGGAPATSVAVNSPAMPAANAPAASSGTGSSAAPAATAAAGGTQINWGELMPAPMLEEQVKILRTRLTGNLQTVATFNKSTAAISLDGAILAALSAVATVHPNEIPWKAKAKFIRDMAFEINANAAGTGREPFTKCKEPFEKIVTMLDGGKPPETEAMDTVPFAEIVYVADMMKQIEASFNALKANINTAARLKEDPAAIERELHILETLATIMADPSYDSAGEDKYQGYLKRFIGGTREAELAVKGGSLETFQAALSQVQATCTECHQEYRANSSGF